MKVEKVSGTFSFTQTSETRTMNGSCEDSSSETLHYRMLRADTSGNAQKIAIGDWTMTHAQGVTYISTYQYYAPWDTQDGQIPRVSDHLVTNADAGVVLSASYEFSAYCSYAGGYPYTTSGCVPGTYEPRLIAISGGSVVSNHLLTGGAPIPVLQAQDGTYFGVGLSDPSSMDAFDLNGNLKWSVPNFYPVMATADGGLIAQSTLNQQYVTFDQNGVANGMLASLPTYSWIGNSYSSSVGSLLMTFLLPSLDFADSFATFVGGSPSPSGANVRDVQAKTFAPYGFYRDIFGNLVPGATQGSAAQDESEWTKDLKQAIPSSKAALDIRMYRNATLSEFLKALDTTNAIVAYVTHGAELTNDNVSRGVCFSGNTCLMDPALTTINGQQLVAPTGWTWDTSHQSMSPKAKVIFLGMCGVTDQFISFWNIQPGQAIIVPVYTANNPNQGIYASEVAWEWAQMLYWLANGKTVQQAVDYGNTFAQARQPFWTWRIVPQGAGNVKF